MPRKNWAKKVQWKEWSLNRTIDRCINQQWEKLKKLNYLPKIGKERTSSPTQISSLPLLRVKKANQVNHHLSKLQKAEDPMKKWNILRLLMSHTTIELFFLKVMWVNVNQFSVKLTTNLMESLRISSWMFQQSKNMNPIKELENLSLRRYRIMNFWRKLVLL